jgi:S-adenosylhomocysteine hydrolase
VDIGSYTSLVADDRLVEPVCTTGCIELAVDLAIEGDAALVDGGAVGRGGSTIAAGCKAVPVAHTEIDLARANCAGVEVAMMMSAVIEDRMATWADVGVVCNFVRTVADGVVRSTLTMPCCL